MLMYPVLLLCKLCSFNASMSVESRNNILLSQLLFFYFLIFFLFLFFFFSSSPSVLSMEFPGGRAALQPVANLPRVSQCMKKLCCQNQVPTCCLWKCCFVFVWAEGRGPYLMLLRETAICTVCTAHASEFPCLWTSEFHIVTVGTQL